MTSFCDLLPLLTKVAAGTLCFIELSFPRIYVIQLESLFGKIRLVETFNL